MLAYLSVWALFPLGHGSNPEWQELGASVRGTQFRMLADTAVSVLFLSAPIIFPHPRRDLMGVEISEAPKHREKPHICALTHNSAKYKSSVIGITVIDIYPSVLCKLAFSIVQSQLDREAVRR